MRKPFLAALGTLVLAGAGITAAVAAAGPAQAAACTVVSPDNSNCGPYDVPAELTPSNGFNTYVGPDVFNPVSGESWKMTVNDPSSWNITADIPNGDTAVSMYPSDGQQFPDPRNPQQGTPLSEFASLTSSFAEAMNANSGTDGEAAYDLWFDNSGAHNELMIQFDNYGAQANCADSIGKVATVTFTDAQHGPQTWDFCLYGTEMIFQLHGIGVEHTGSVDLLAMMRWVQARGYIASTALFTLMGFGAEFCSTGGQAETFQVSQLNALATYTSGPSPSPSPTSTSPSPSPTTPTPTATSPSPSPTATSPSPSPTGTSLLAGDSAVEGIADWSNQGQAEAFSYVAARSGTSQTASFYVDPAYSTATAGVLGIYTDSGYNSPGTLLKQAAFTPHSGWNTVTLPGAAVTAGRKYWLAELGVSGRLAERDQGSGVKDEESAQTNLTSLPSRWLDGTAWDSGHASFYVSGS